MRRHIFFTGFMASGKSRTGRALAERLERPFVDTDSLIVERVGKSISDIFAQEGEAFFRRIQTSEEGHEISPDELCKVSEGFLAFDLPPFSSVILSNTPGTSAD